METPDKIKKGLEKCSRPVGTCRGDCPYYNTGIGVACIPAMSADSLAYIKQLEAENAQLKQERDNAAEELQRVKTEQENLICAFMDFVNDGVHNPAPYCAMANALCVDGRGWCKPGCATCNGFVPKVRAENENA